MPKKSDKTPTGDEKTGRGGKREGAGAKPKGTAPRVLMHARIDPEALKRIDAIIKKRGITLGDYWSEHGLSLPPVKTRC